MATEAQQKSFIMQIAPLMQAEAKKRGYKICSGAIAQACLESAYGTSSLGYKYHNYFGLKCGSSWKGKSVNMKTREEYTPGTLTTIRDNFRAYDSMAAGVAGYYDFIQSKRYAALRSATSAQDYLEKIKAAGYATSSQYVANNMAVVRRHSLVEWDEDPAAQVSHNTYLKPTRTLKKGHRGADVMWLQTALNEHGYGLKVDGIFGPKTEFAVRDWQMRAHITIDGLAGRQTIASLY